jgi:hypothetical protein
MILPSRFELAALGLPKSGARYRRVLGMVCCIARASNGVMGMGRLGQTVGRNHLCTTITLRRCGLGSRPDTFSGRRGIDVPAAANRYVKWQKALSRRKSRERGGERVEKAECQDRGVGYRRFQKGGKFRPGFCPNPSIFASGVHTAHNV